MARPPAARIAAARSSAGSTATSPTTTDAPSSARRRAVAAPMPVAPPATTATFPSSPRMRRRVGTSELRLVVAGATVGGDLAARDPLRLVGCEPHGGVADVAWIADPEQLARRLGAPVLRVRDDAADDDRVATDPLRAVLDREHPRQGVHAALRRAVGRQPGYPEHRTARRDVHDRAAAGLDHVRDRVLR